MYLCSTFIYGVVDRDRGSEKLATYFITKTKQGRKKNMAMAPLPTVRRLPLTSCRTTAPTSSPLSVRRPRPRALSLPRFHCCASRTPHPLAAARDAAASWAGKMAGAVPWKAAVSGVLAVAVSFTCRKLCLVFTSALRFTMLRGTFPSEGGGRALVPNCSKECYLCVELEHALASSPIYTFVVGL